MRKETLEIRPEITESFGPWMIAARNSRRPNRDNAKKGVYQRKSDGKSEENNKGKNLRGSRFVVLHGEDENEEENQAHYDEPNEIYNKGEEFSGPKSRGNVRGKRPTVQVNEKQIMGEIGVREDINDKGESSGKREGMARTLMERNHNRAAEEIEHTVIMATDNGARKFRRVVTNEGDILMEEHHNDPSTLTVVRMEVDHGGGRVMCMESSRAAGEGEQSC